MVNFHAVIILDLPGSVSAWLATECAHLAAFAVAPVGARLHLAA
jgi:hypothetical protein